MKMQSFRKVSSTFCYYLLIFLELYCVKVNLQFLKLFSIKMTVLCFFLVFPSLSFPVYLSPSATPWNRSPHLPH